MTSRMLSVRPEARGSARELAEALEQAADTAGPEADVPLFILEEPRPVEARAAPASRPASSGGPLQAAWLVAAGLGGATGAGSRVDAERSSRGGVRGGARFRFSARGGEGWRHRGRRGLRADGAGASHPGTLRVVDHRRGRCHPSPSQDSGARMPTAAVPASCRCPSMAAAG